LRDTEFHSRDRRRPAVAIGGFMKKAVAACSAFAAAAALSASASAADVCLQIDASRDNLSREERAEAQ
jgi:thiamine monophosphate synthase